MIQIDRRHFIASLGGVGRHFKNPKEGLGNDDSPVAHMWRTIAMPDNPL